MAGLRRQSNGNTVLVAGLVTTRQPPDTAHGITFLLLKDETGMPNVIVSPELYERDRLLRRTKPLILIEGRLQRQAMQLNLVAARGWPLTETLPDEVQGAQRVYQALRDWRTAEPQLPVTIRVAVNRTLRGVRK